MYKICIFKVFIKIFKVKTDRLFYLYICLILDFVYKFSSHINYKDLIRIFHKIPYHLKIKKIKFKNGLINIIYFKKIIKIKL